MHSRPGVTVSALCLARPDTNRFGPTGHSASRAADDHISLCAGDTARSCGCAGVELQRWTAVKYPPWRNGCSQIGSEYVEAVRCCARRMCGHWFTSDIPCAEVCVCANEIQSRRCYERALEGLNGRLGRCGEVGAEGPTSATPSLG